MARNQGWKRNRKQSAKAPKQFLIEGLEQRQLLSGAVGETFHAEIWQHLMTPDVVVTKAVQTPSDRAAAAAARKAVVTQKLIDNFETHLRREVHSHPHQLTNPRFQTHIANEQTAFAVRIAKRGGSYTPIPFDALAVGAAPLVAPTLTATAASNTSITVAWTTVTGATKYTLQTSLNGASWSTLTTTTSTTTYTHTGLLSDSSHKYRVTATVGSKSTPQSAVKTATTLLAPVTGLAATTYSATRIDLKWTPITHATSYKIERSTNQTTWAPLTPSPALTGTSSTYSDTTASAGTTYYYRITANEVGGTSGVSSVVHALTLPASPVLTATASSATAIALSWTTISGATSYFVELSINGGATWSSLVTQATATYSNTGLTPDTQYQYRVTAINATGNSPVSSTATATTLLTAPTGLAATAASATVINLVWTDVVDATTYKIERSTDQTTWSPLAPNPHLTGSNATYSDTTVSAGTTYYYRISSTDAAGTSAASSAVHALTVPAVPTLTATVASATSVGLSWTSVTGATSYLVEKSSDGGLSWSSLVTQATLTYSNTGLTADTQYKYRVSAIDATGASNTSVVATATTLLVAPTGLTATAVSGTEIDLVWTPVADASSYKIERSTNQTTWTALAPNPALSSTSSSYNDTTGVSAGTTYYYRISAIDAAGTSAASTVANALTFPATPVLTVTVGSATSINLSWVAITGATSYVIESSSDGGNTWSNLPSQNGITYVNTGLTADTQYKYRIHAVNATGSSATSSVSTITTLLTATTGLTATAISATQINLAWTPETDATNYKIERSLDQTAWTPVVPNPALNGGSLSYSDSALTAGTTYYYRISGIDAAGTSAASTVAHALTFPAQPVLTATVGSATSINLSWVAIKGATTYLVESSADGGLTWSTLGNPSTITYTNTGLTADTQYKYRVSATNATGNSAPSAVSTITTLLLPPTGLAATVASATEIDLVWIPVFDATNYKIERSVDQNAWSPLAPNPALTGTSASYHDTTVFAGTTYYYRISSIDAAGTSAAAASVHGLTLAAAPTLTATVSSASVVNLTWTASTSATTYLLQSSTDGGTTWSTLATQSTLTYSNTGLTADTQYKYRVTANNATGASAASAVATVTTTLGAPTNFAATVASATEIDLSWTAVTHATNYKLETSLNQTTWTTVVANPAFNSSSASYAVTGLTAGTTYYYRLSVINAVGTSVASTVVHGLTLSGAPVLTAVVFSANQVNLTWTASPSAISYKVEISSDGGSTYSTLASTTALLFNSVGLTADTAYKFRVTAVNPSGNSLASNIGSVTTLPAAPAGFSATASTTIGTEIDLAWTAVTHATAYKIERSTDNITFTVLSPNPVLAGTDHAYHDTGVVAGTTYYYRISTIDTVGTSVATAVVQALTIPATPTLSFTAAATSVALSWTSSTGAASYLVEHSVDAGTTWTTLATPSGTTYSDTSLTADTEYQYRVSAVNATGTSAASSVADVTTLLNAPASFTATASTSVATQIALSWTAVTHATGYKIERSTNQTTWNTLSPNPVLAGTDHTYTDASGSAGTTYYYRISSIDAAGTSVSSGVQNATTIPAVPTLTATAASATSVNLTWTAATGATAYLLEVSADAGTTWTTAASQAGNSFTATSLTADTAYQYRVSASDATGTSATSTVANVTTILGAVTNFAVTPSTTSPTTIALAWTAVADSTAYKIERSVNQSVWTTLSPNPVLAGTDHAYSDTSVSAGTIYFYRISAVNAVGTSAATSAVSGLTIPATPTLTATVALATSINLSWTAVKAATGYLLEQSIDQGTHWTTAVSQVGTTFTATGLTADMEYQYRVSALDATGASPTSTAADLTTILGAVTNFTAMASTSVATEIDLAWTAVAHATGYKIERSLDNSIWTTLSPNPVLAGTDHVYVDASASAGTTYFYRISAINAVGTSAATSAVHDTTIPAVPTLTATVVSATAVNLSWTSVTGATAYLLEVSANAGTTWTTAASQAGTTFAATGLTADSPYQYRVSASDATGFSATSTVASITTILGAVTNFTVTPSTSSGTTIALSWTAVTDATGYKIERSLNQTVWTTLSPNPVLAGTDHSYSDTSVSTGTVYFYRISAVNAVGTSAATSAASGLTIPAVPTLTITNLTLASVAANWTSVKGASSYLLELSADSGTTWITAVSQAGTGFTVGSLAGDALYEFRVSASNATGSSATSTVVNDTTILPAVAAITATANATVDTRIDLSWSPVMDATGYKLERSLDNSVWTTLSPNPAIAGTAGAYADNSVLPGTTYYYRISAVNANGTSAATAAAHALTIPAAPTLVAATVSATAINLTWNPVFSATSYLLEVTSNSGTTWTTAASQAGTSFSATSLTADTSYEYRVSAINATGPSLTSTVVTQSTLLAAPASFTATASTTVDTEVDLAWTAVTDATAYLVERSPNGTLWATLTQSPVLAGTDHAYADTTATPGTTFFYRISAIGTAGTSAPATVASALTLPDVPVLTAGQASATENDLSWTPIQSATSYLLEKSIDAGTHWTTLATQASTQFADTGLTADTAYQYRVSAINATGAGATSTVSTITTILGSPTNLALTAASATEVDLTYTAVAHATAYIIERSDDAGVTWTTLTQNPVLAGTDHAFADTTALAGTLYSYQVSAVNANGVSDPCTPVTVTTPLAAPTGFTATAVSSSQINLAWNADTDAGLLHFLIQGSSDGTTWTDLETVAAGSTSASDVRLTTATTYHYRLIAVNAGGNSAPTAGVMATTM